MILFLFTKEWLLITIFSPTVSDVYAGPIYFE